MRAVLDAQAVSLPLRLEPTDLALQAGTMTALIGPNGGGKTSLLRSLARIDRPGGTVVIAGEDVDRAPPPRRRQLLTYLPAARDVIWPISARDLIALGLDRPRSERVDELIGLLELEPLADRPADRLSTGERARVLLARSMAPRPSVLLLDEPLSNLDPYWVLRIVALLRACAEEGAAVLVALHDLNLLADFDRALLVAGGRIHADAEPPVVLEHPSFEQAFRVRRSGRGWSVSPADDRRSSR
jgi:iron complex transport system ATP-binding protein